MNKERFNWKSSIRMNGEINRSSIEVERTLKIKNKENKMQVGAKQIYLGLIKNEENLKNAIVKFLHEFPIFSNTKNIVCLKDWTPIELKEECNNIITNIIDYKMNRNKDKEYER